MLQTRPLQGPGRRATRRSASGEPRKHPQAERPSDPAGRAEFLRLQGNPEAGLKSTTAAPAESRAPRAAWRVSHNAAGVGGHGVEVADKAHRIEIGAEGRAAIPI